MRRLLILVLLSSAAVLIGAAPQCCSEPVVCTDDDIAKAARLAVQHINKYHHHGYKFRLNQTRDHKFVKTDNSCHVELDLDLLETKCHIVNPKPFEDCPLREDYAGAVIANCSVRMNREDEVNKYVCDTKQVLLNREMVTVCPDCPILIPLNSTEGLKSVDEAVKKFNENTTHRHYYILKEVGRIRSGFIMMSGMNYYAEFALVETFCPIGSKIAIEACQPRCPDRAHHALCRSSYSSTNGLGSLECEIYPPLNTTALGPGEKETICRHRGHHPPHGHGHGHGHRHGHGHGRPPLPPPPPPPPDHGHGHGHGHGPPPPDHGHGHGHGPPPPPPPPDHGHGHGHGHGPPPPPPPPPPDHGHGQGPPAPPPPHDHTPHDHGQGPPAPPPPHANDHGQGPPPHAHDHSQGPPPGHGGWHHHKSFLPCHGVLAYVDPALHPICPWPLPEHRPKPKPSQS